MAKKEAVSSLPLTISQARTLAGACIDKGHALLLTGAPGVGKSDLVAQAAEDAGAKLILSHPVTSDPTDAKGLPWKVDGREAATFLPFGDLEEAINAKEKTVWFLDDLGQATPAVQASFMQLLLARKVNGHALPDVVTFVAATNRRTDRAGVQGILEPVKSRFVSIVELQPTVDDWSAWAIQAGVRPEVVAFLRFRKELLHQFEATADLTNSPCPRTWAHLAKLHDLGLPKNLRLQAYAGAVGQAAASEFISYLSIYENAPSIDAIFADPKGAPIPEEVSALYAVAAGLAHAASKKNIGSISIYAQRLFAAKKGEFATLTIRDSARRDKTILKTNEYVQYCLSDAGKHIVEAATDQR